MKTDRWPVILSIIEIILSILKVIAATMVGLAASILCFLHYLVDGRPDEGPAVLLIIWPVFVLGGLYVALLLPRVWYLAIAIAWPSIFHFGLRPIYADSGHDWYDVSVTYLSPFVALGAGYLGSLIHKGLHPPTTMRSKIRRLILIALLTVPALLLWRISAFAAVVLFDWSRQLIERIWSLYPGP